MRDYYSEFLTKNWENIAEDKLTLLTVAKKTAEKNIPVSSVSELSTENLKSDFLTELFKDNEMKEQFEFEVEERTAIMVFDGGKLESEAVSLAYEDVKDVWLALFNK